MADVSVPRAMNRDPTYFPDCDAFRPERYLDANGQLADTIPDTHHWGHGSFGAGRRFVFPHIAHQAQDATHEDGPHA